jgi:Sulfotransferase family
VGSLEENATFICGHPKSGTSLLRAMLDSHPQLTVFPEETKFFRRVLPGSLAIARQERPRAVADHILHVFQWSSDSPTATQAGFLDRDYSHRSHARVLESYRRRVAGWAGDMGSLLSAAILAYGDASGRQGPETQRWVEKSPYNERFAHQIFNWWPEARCLHVVRDPRDNYASYLRKHPEWSPAAFAQSWKQSAARGWRNQRQFGPNRYLILRFEDLVLDTERAIAEIILFLGIHDAASLRAPTRDGTVWKGNSMFGDAFDGISRRPLGRYAGALAESDRRRIEAQLEPEMLRLSYPLTRPLSPAERVAGRVRRAKWAWRSIWLACLSSLAGSPGGKRS